MGKPILSSLAAWFGSAAEPSYGFSGDEDTGMFRPAADSIGWATAGVERLRLGPTGLLTSSTAITLSSTDNVAGRLLKVGAGIAQLDTRIYNRTNILATVGQSSGVPTGGIIERGSNANGDYIRFADGTQICMFNAATFAFLDADNLSFTWTFPAGFLTGTMPPRTLGYSNSAGDLTGITIQQLGNIRLGAGINSAATRIARAQGAASFVAGNQIANCQIMAHGRWF